jgi:hypothetical protein
VQSADFQVLRETEMPGVLVEYGFMDNLTEAKLLLTEAYRAECAIELAKGICEYLGCPFEDIVAKIEPLPTIQDRVNIIVNSVTMPQGYFIGEATYVPIRAISVLLAQHLAGMQQQKQQL